MKLETKYGIIEGTVEDFKELLEDKKDLSYLSGEAECSQVKEDTYFVVTRNVESLFKSFVLDKGTVLKKLDKHGYRDTLGNVYLLSGDVKDISKEPGIERLFEQAVGEEETLLYSIG